VFMGIGINGIEDGYCIIGMQPRGWNYIGLAQAESEDKE